LVHGIVSLDPPTVRCDGCGFEATGESLGVVVFTCGILFNPKAYSLGDKRRLCRDCAAEAGWHA
jgi:hypothetical protein